MRQFSNVSIESSCLQGFRTVPLLVQEFGAERVLFGAGLPIQYPACGLAKLDDPELTEAHLALIRGVNMDRLMPRSPGGA
jgi:predicted TIM-barrel fold metal-dependent hydrolase